MDFLYMQLVFLAPTVLSIGLALFVIAVLDIRARRKAEYQEQELLAIVSSMDDGLIVVGTDERITIANQTAGVLLRQAPSELMGKKIETVLQLRDKQTRRTISSSEIVRQVMNEKDIVRFTEKQRITCRNSLGKYLPIQLVATPFFHKKQLHGVIILMRKKD